MTYFIDRRLNPKGKSLANRQRFLRRARAQIREAVQKNLKDSGVADIAKDRKIKISTQGTREPRFRLDPKKAGARDFVLPGNKDYVAGDQIKKPPQGEGGRGKEASTSGEGEDDFEFTMRQDEILDIFFEDLELPNLVRTTLAEVQTRHWRRAGFSTSGSPNQINLVRTMRNSFGRRLALKRPSLADVKALEEEIVILEEERGLLRETTRQVGRDQRLEPGAAFDMDRGGRERRVQPEALTEAIGGRGDLGLRRLVRADRFDDLVQGGLARVVRAHRSSPFRSFCSLARVRWSVTATVLQEVFKRRAISRFP